MLILSHGCPRGSTREATDFFCRVYRAGTTLDLTHRNAYDILITGLITNGIWGMLDALWILGTQNQIAAMINLVSDDYALTMHGTIPFTVDDGFTSTGVAGSYFDTGVNLSTTTKFARTSGHISGWCFSNIPDAGITQLMDAAFNGSQLLPRAMWGPAFSGGVNMPLGSANFAYRNNGMGFHVTTRSSEAANQLFSNGAVMPTQANGSYASTPPINGPLPLLASFYEPTGTVTSTWGGLLLACASIGSGFPTGSASTQPYFNLLYAYFTAVRGSPPPTT